MNYQVIYLNNPDAEAVTMLTVTAANIGAAIDIFLKNYGIAEAQILAVIQVNEE
jgi:hypothetical protein